MSEYDDLLPDEDDPRFGDSSVEPPSEEEESLPSLVMASDLLPQEDPLAAIPQEPPDEDTPPDVAFLIVKDAYGPGVHSVKLSDGTPVGRWLDSTHPTLTGSQVEDLLASMGLEEVMPGRSAWFGKQRDARFASDTEVAGLPLVQAGVKREAERAEEKDKIQAAFIEAQRKKEKKK